MSRPQLRDTRGLVVIEVLAALLITGLPVAVIGGSALATIDDTETTVAILVGALTVWKVVISPLQKMERRSRHIPWIVDSIKRHDKQLGLEPLENPADEV